MKPSRHFLLFIGLIAWAALAGQVSFEATADARQVVLPNYFEVSFTLRNAEGRGFRPPAFSDFNIISGPSQSISTTIINGQVYKELSFTYQLQPKREGRLVVGSATIQANGKTLTTQPLTVEVVEGKAQTGRESDQFFIRAEPLVTEAYIGQQVMLDYKLYTTVLIDNNYNILRESDYPGFFAEDLTRFGSRFTREVINGVQYATRVLKRVALFPQQTGNLIIEPMQVQLGLIIDDPNRSGSFFFGREIVRTITQSEPVNIQVKLLPDSAPPSFTGAVGRYSLQTAMNRTVVTTDDALTLQLSIMGNGDIKRVQIPDLSFPESFEVYDPRVIEETNYELSGELAAKKVMEYLLLPKEPGEYTLKPEFTYFDPDSARYITVSQNIYTITVRPGMGRIPAVAGAEAAAEGVQDIRFIKLGTALQRGDRYFIVSPVFWVLSGIPLLLVAFSFVLKKRAHRLSSMDPQLIKSRRARKAAERRLSTANQHLLTGKSRLFYDEISKAMLGYVCDKLNIPLSGLTKEKVQEKLRILNVSSDHIERFQKVIQTCEMALFAGKDHSEAMNETYQAAVQVLVGIEEEVSG